MFLNVLYYYIILLYYMCYTVKLLCMLPVGVVSRALVRGRWESISKILIFHRRRRINVVNTRIWLTRGVEKTTLTTIWEISCSFYQVTLNLTRDLDRRNAKC